MNPLPVPSGFRRILPADPHLVWNGRVLFEREHALYDWPGVMLSFRIRGDAFALDVVDGGNDHDLLVDGEIREVWRTRAGEDPKRVEGLGPGAHEIRLVKRTEATYGETCFGGLLLPETVELMSPPSLPDRRILFVGDSLTCGYGVEGNDPLCPGCRGLENVSKSYAGITARELGASGHFIAWSGKGLIRNYGDPERGSPDPIPSFWRRTCAGRKEPSWDPSAWIPHLVVLQFGSNDFSTPPCPDPVVWTERYVAFAREVLAECPGAKLLCVSREGVPPLAEQVRDAVARLRERGIPDPGLATWDKFNIREMGCDYHPHEGAQRRMAERVLAEARALMGWPRRS